MNFEILYFLVSQLYSQVTGIFADKYFIHQTYDELQEIWHFYCFNNPTVCHRDVIVSTLSSSSTQYDVSPIMWWIIIQLTQAFMCRTTALTVRTALVDAFSNEQVLTVAALSHCSICSVFSCMCNCAITHNSLVKVKWQRQQQHRTGKVTVCIIIYSHIIIFFTYYILLLLLQFWSLSVIHFQYSHIGSLWYLFIFFIFMHADYYISQEQDANK